MSERDGYDSGIPCWIDHSSKDPESAVRFYGELFGWATEDQMPPEAPGNYFMCRLRGRDVAAIGSQMDESSPPSWNTYIAVDSADDAASKVKDAGGQVFAEPFDVFDAGRMAVLADPAGAVFQVWQAGQHKGAGLVNEPGALAWNELTTRDPESSKEFYGKVFGWQTSEMASEGPPYTIWHNAGVEVTQGTGMAGMMPMVGDQWPADLPSHWMVYFAVDDTDATVDRCQQLGGKVSQPGFDTPAGRIALLNDPLGAVFSVIKLVEM